MLDPCSIPLYLAKKRCYNDGMFEIKGKRYGYRGELRWFESNSKKNLWKYSDGGKRVNFCTSSMAGSNDRSC